MSLGSALFFKKLYALFVYLSSGIFVNVLLRFIAKCEIFFMRFMHSYMNSETQNLASDLQLDFDVFGIRGGRIMPWLLIISIPLALHMLYWCFDQADVLESVDEDFFDDFVGPESYQAGMSRTIYVDPNEEWDIYDNAVEESGTRL